MSFQGASLSSVRRARRFMLAGLLLSIVGTRLIEGGTSGVIAAGLLPVVFVALYGTGEQVLGVVLPFLGPYLQRFRPAQLLVGAEALDAAASLSAAVFIIVQPASTIVVFVVYLVLAVIVPNVVDLVEEFYAQQVAQVDGDQALVFNANLDSVSAAVGFIVATPLGAFVSGRSISALLLINAALSLGACVLRFTSTRSFAPAAVNNADGADPAGFLGERSPVSTFVSGLRRTGPTSPALAMVISATGGLAGTYLFLWIARSSSLPISQALALVLAVFGVGATIGPQIARLARRRWNTDTLLVWTTALVLANAVMAIALIAGSWLGARTWVYIIIYVGINAIGTRCRATLITTLRQTSFRGSEFTAVLSWSYSLSAIGLLLGLWGGYLLRVDQNPVVGLCVIAALATVSLRTMVNYRAHERVCTSDVVPPR